MIIFTKHALERMKQRGITKEEVQRLIQEAKPPFSKDKHGHLIVQKKVNGKLLRVFFQKEGENFIIITAYKTAKIDKYLKK